MFINLLKHKLSLSIEISSIDIPLVWCIRVSRGVNYARVNVEDEISRVSFAWLIRALSSMRVDDPDGFA